jgi:hypothetical protein
MTLALKLKDVLHCLKPEIHLNGTTNLFVVSQETWCVFCITKTNLILKAVTLKMGTAGFFETLQD